MVDNGLDPEEEFKEMTLDFQDLYYSFANEQSE